MKFAALLFLAALGVAGAEEECSQERAERCVDDMLTALLGDTTQDQVCDQMRNSIECLRRASRECLEEENDEVEGGLKELQNLMEQSCGEEEQKEEDEETGKCLDSNEDYFYECVYEGSTQALADLLRQGDDDENKIKCSVYGFIANCFVERVRSRCGEEAATAAKEELEDLPSEIQEACDASATLTLQLLDRE